jgi:hypothetical protein
MKREGAVSVAPEAGGRGDAATCPQAAGAISAAIGHHADILNAFSGNVP